MAMTIWRSENYAVPDGVRTADRATRTITVMLRLTTGTRSEKCVVRRFRRCANVIFSTYANHYSTAYYTPRLYNIAYCS
jgi:hypothetical protein